VALEAEPSTNCCRRHAVLTRSGLRDDALLAHALREQSLAETVVDLVSAGMIQVLALEINLRTAPGLRQTRREIQRRRPARVVVKEIVQIRMKRRIALRFEVGRLEFLQRMHEGFWNELPTVFSEMTFHGAS